MAIASGGTLGTGAHSTSASSFTFTTATNTLASGDTAVLVVSTDNLSTSDGQTSDHTTPSGGTGVWSKLGEYTNSPGGAAGDGVTVSAWLFRATGTVNTGTTITVNLAGAVVDKSCAFWKYTVAAGKTLIASASLQTSEVNGANGFGSSAFSGLSSLSRLYLRALAKEANSTTALTVSTNFTEITGTRSRNNSSAVIVRGEFRINTSTGETSNPTLAVSGDSAGIFLALEEAADTISGSTSSTLGAATLSAAGTVATPSYGTIFKVNEVAASLGPNGGTLGPIDLTGADSMIVSTATDNSAGGLLATTDITGTGSPTWVEVLELRLTQGSVRHQTFFCTGITGTGTHSVVISKTGCYCGAVLSGWSTILSTASPKDQTDGATDTDGSVSTGSVTPSTQKQLVYTSLAHDNGGAVTNPLTLIATQAHVAFNSYGVSAAYEVQGSTPTARNPAWSTASAVSVAAGVVTFKAGPSNSVSGDLASTLGALSGSSAGSVAVDGHGAETPEAFSNVSPSDVDMSATDLKFGAAGMAVRPTTNRIVVGVDKQGLLASDNGGRKFYRIYRPNGGTTLDGHAWSISWASDDSWFACNNGYGTLLGVWRSTDGGVTLERCLDADINTVMINPWDPTEAFACPHGPDHATGHYYRTNDSGDNWDDLGVLGPGIYGDGDWVTINRLIICTPNGLYKVVRSGSTFAVTLVLALTGPHGGFKLFNDTVNGRIYVGGQRSSDNFGVIYYSDDDGDTWTLAYSMGATDYGPATIVASDTYIYAIGHFATHDPHGPVAYRTLRSNPTGWEVWDIDYAGGMTNGANGACVIEESDGTVTWVGACANAGVWRYVETAPRLGAMTLSATGGAVVERTGSLSATLGALTAAGTGGVLVSGATSSALGAATATATGGVTVSGSTGATLGAATTAATGTVAVAGATAATLGAVTTSATGAIALSGATNATLGELTLSASSGSGVVGSVDATLGAVTSTATAGVTVSGTATVTFGPLTAVGTGQLPIGGATTATLGAVTTAATGLVGLSGTISQSLGAVALSGSGSVGGGAITGTGSLTFGLATVAWSGAVLVSGSLGSMLGALSLAPLGSPAFVTLSGLYKTSVEMTGLYSSGVTLTGVFSGD